MSTVDVGIGGSMQLTRTTALTALLLAALAAPVAAFALDEDPAGPGRTRAEVAKQDGKHGDDKDGDKKPGDKKGDESSKQKDKPGHVIGPERADDASAAGRAHAEAMKVWAECVAAAASGPKTGEHTGPPKEACGEKPMGPGRAKHEAEASEHPSPPGKSEDRPRGKSGTHRSH